MVNWKDPLRVNLGDHHKRLLSLIWILIIVALMLLLIVVGTLEGWPRGLSNNIFMVTMFLVIILAWILIEKSKIEIKAVKKAKSKSS